MTTHMLNWSPGMSADQVVLRALDVADLHAIDLKIQRCDGPSINPYVTVWYLWSLPEAMSPILIDSVLDEDDPEDQPFPCRNGFVAVLIGSTTAYVFTAQLRSNNLKQEMHNLVTTAEHPFFAPRPAGVVGEA